MTSTQNTRVGGLGSPLNGALMEHIKKGQLARISVVYDEFGTRIEFFSRLATDGSKLPDGTTEVVSEVEFHRRRKASIPVLTVEDKLKAYKARAKTRLGLVVEVADEAAMATHLASLSANDRTTMGLSQSSFRAQTGKSGSK